MVFLISISQFDLLYQSISFRVRTLSKTKTQTETGKENRPITLVTDGWSSIKNDPIIAVSIHTGKSSSLLSTIECGPEKKTAEYCYEIIRQNITKVNQEYNKDLFAVVTDNENKMKSLRTKIEEENPNILTYGCNSHYLNLVEQTVTPQTIIKHIVEIHKYFRNHHIPHSLLKDRDGAMPQLPNDTRWNSQLACLQTFCQNFHLYRDIAKNYDDMDNQIKRKIDDMNLYKNAIDLQDQLEIVGKSLDFLQGDNVGLSDAVETWLNLISEKKLEFYNEALKKRFNQAMEPFHFLAYLTDPKRKLNSGDIQGPNNSDLDYDNRVRAEEWLHNKYPQFVPGFLSYCMSDCDIFSKTMFEKEILKNFNGYKWWLLNKDKFMQKLKDLKKQNENNETSIEKYENLVDMRSFFSNLHSCPASSASIERIFSTFGHVWSKLRNQLGVEKVSKMVKIYRFLNKPSKSK